MATGNGRHGDEPAGTPSEQSVEEDFTMPGDADLRPAGEDTEDGTVHEDES